ncbi:hypothetical protein FHS95_002970 [Sphingomonas naasensis]|uniref:Lipoprotein n=1 Tax=Sphingomonas naasensis TaxID=1344951 RepID=A0A4S1WA04_9SPHN|nr:hypothetical protein [Sphingomonas naasensis]NIJ21267.1 hypothetical protein [Sphingomonas naasensis]TGX38705.1 hypothetical protein E5A74_17885 [Sphingomonas naasensis]
MIRTTTLLALAASLLAGCAVPEARLRSGLIRAGLPKPLSACMAERMVDRLSLKQLMRIADLPYAGGAESVDQFLHRVRALGDAEILGVTSSSAALCATGLAG